MSAPKDHPMVYAASCNPPRRAKRQRTGSLGGDAPPVAPSPTTAASPQQRRVAPRPPILPKGPVAERDFVPPDSDSVSDEEDDYDPGRDAAPAPKRRGRKPGTMSRSARESLRKLNHSRIEKARRTKINETLATLSTLVGEREQVLPVEKTEVSTEKVEEKGKKGKGRPEEKEFKLDVLVKTVEYMQELIARVQALETGRCSQCHSDIQADVPATLADVPPSPKRKRTEDTEMEDVEHVARRRRPTPEEDDFYGGDDEHGLGAADEEQPSPMPFAAPGPAQPTASPRLPPIASWLPHPYVDPSSLMGASSGSAKTVTSTPGPTRSPPNAQLPSPPPSGRFRPAITLANMPALTLPGPAHPLAPPPQKSMPPPQRQPQPHQQQQQHRHRKSVSGSPTASPMWTPEDESAASLLLQIGSKPRSSSVSSTSGSSAASSSLPRSILPMTPVDEGPRDRAGAGAYAKSVAVEVVTPGSLLGMRD